MNFRKKLTAGKHDIQRLIQTVGVTNDLMSADEAWKRLQSYYPRKDTGCLREAGTLEYDTLKEEEKVSLSVIMPVYNVEQYVEQAVRSVLNQKTEYSFELILVNDGAIDSSGEIISKFESDERVRIITQKNRGLSGARNSGIEKSHGTYLFFIDSDDALCEGALQSMMKCAVDNRAEIVCGNYYNKRDGRLTKQTFFKTGKCKASKLPGFAWGKVIHRSFFDHLCFPEGYWFEDSIFKQVIYPRCKNCYTVEDYIYEWLYNVNGITRTALKTNPKSLESLYLYDYLLERRNQFGLELNQASYEYFLHMVLANRKRTMPLPDEIRKCVFSVQCDLKKRIFMEYSSSRGKQLEEALLHENYRKYMRIPEDQV